jgi:cyclophilin family peptidyl-prolyl cis-trans isomerase
VPSAKRARQRAAREARLAALEQRRRRRAALRRFIIIVVLVAAAVGIYKLVSGRSTQSAQAAANQASAAAGCPSDPKTVPKKQSWSEPPAQTIDPSKTYTATVRTDIGTFVIDLDAAKAPKTVNNFVFLANQHFYDCTVFPRGGKGFVVQGGSPTAGNTGGPGYQFADENLPTTGPNYYPLGSLAMANSGPNTNGSQFFIIVGSAGEQLQPNYSLFGQVTSGMKVVQKIAAHGGSAQSNYTPVKVTHRILTMTIKTS